MNNKTASMIRDFGMARVFDGMDFSELVKIDSGKFVFPINTDEGDFWCEVDFVAKFYPKSTGKSCDFPIFLSVSQL